MLPFLSAEDMAAACACIIYLGSDKWIFAGDVLPSFLYMMTPLTLALLDKVSCVLSPSTIHIESIQVVQQSKKIQPCSFTPFQEVIILQEKTSCATVQ